MRSSTIFLVFLISCTSFGQVHQNSRHGATEVCHVADETRLGEGYNIASKERCQQFCKLTPNCRFWTWYKSRKIADLDELEEEIFKENVCYALNSCHLATEKCHHCASGPRVNNPSRNLNEKTAREAARRIIRDERQRQMEREDL